MKRTRRVASLILVFFSGWLFASVTYGPNMAWAGGKRPSIASILASINSIIDGSTEVGNATNASSAQFAETAIIAEIAEVADITFCFQAQEDSSAANVSNEGKIRYSPATSRLEYSNGSEWVPLAIE